MLSWLMRASGLLFACIGASGKPHDAEGASAAKPGFSIEAESKLRGGLVDVVHGALPGELIPVIVAMRESGDPAIIEQASQMRDKSLRRELVVGTLKGVASNTQGPVLDLLREEQALGGAGQRLHPLWITNAICADLTAAVIHAIAARDDVEYLHYDPPIGEEIFPAQPPGNVGAFGEDAQPLGQQIECGVALMRAPEVWDQLDITGREVVVAVIDTGCCITHPDLVNQIWTNEGEIPGNGIDDDGNGFIDDIYGWSFDRNGSNNNITDTSGHGTHVSGTIVGDGTNGVTTGMAPDALLMTLKFFKAYPNGQESVWRCTEYAVENGAQVISGSLGWYHSWNPDRRRFREVYENAIAAGVVIVFAAGNEGVCCPPYDNVRTPADVPDIISIGATDCNDIIATWSSRGPVTWQDVDPYYDWPYPPGKMKPSVSAPGVNTISTSWDCSAYRTTSGTSMAAPHVAGAVALMLEANPNLDHWQVKQILKDTAVDLGLAGPDNTYGAGRVDAYEAVLAALGTGSNVATLVDVDFIRGALVSGGIEDLVESDDSYLVGRSQYAFSAAEPNQIDMVVGAETNASSPATLDLTVEARLNNPAGNARLRLRNWSTNNFQAVHQYVLGTSEVVTVVPDLPAANRVRASDGRIEVSFRVTMFATFSVEGFRSFADHVEVVVKE